MGQTILPYRMLKSPHQQVCTSLTVSKNMKYSKGNIVNALLKPYISGLHTNLLHIVIYSVNTPLLILPVVYWCAKRIGMLKHKSDSSLGCRGLEFILNLSVVSEYK